MSDSTVGMKTLWGHVFDLHTAFQRTDLAEITTQIAVFPANELTRDHLDAAGDLLYALVRYESEDSEFSTTIKSSYAATYESSYEVLVRKLLSEPTPALAESSDGI